MKKIITFAALLFVAVAFWTWKPLTTTILQYSVENYFRKNFGIEIVIPKISQENQVILIENPIFKGNVEGYAQRLEIGYYWELWKRILHLDIELIEPHLSLSNVKENEINSSSFNVLSVPDNPFHVQGSISVLNGFVKIPEQNQEMALQLEGQWDTKGKGHCTTLLQNEHSHLAIALTKNFEGKISTIIEMNRFHLSILKDFIKRWFPYENWQVCEGLATGNLNINSHLESQRISGELLAENLSITHLSYPFFAIIPSVLLKFQDHSIEKGKAELLQPAFISFQSPDGTPWHLKNVIGEIKLQQNDIITQLKANSVYHNTNYPLVVQTQSNLLNDNHKLEFNFLMNPEVNSSINIDLTKADDENYLVLADFTKCVPWQDHISVNAKWLKNSDNTTFEGFFQFIDDISIPLKFDFSIDLRKDQSSQGKLNYLGYSLSKSSFEVTKVPIERIARFLTQDPNYKGFADIYGVMDENSLYLEYLLDNFSCENSKLTFESLECPCIGAHYIDLHSGKHGGVLSLCGAKYQDKTYDLLFSEIASQLEFEGTQIYATDLSAYCCDIYLSGVGWTNFLTDDASKKIIFNAQTLNGKISQVKDVLSHFKIPSPYLQVPLEGDVALREQGGHIEINFISDKMDVQCEWHASLTDGILNLPNFSNGIKDLHANFDFNLKENKFAFSDVHGTLFMDDHEYYLIGDYLRWSDFVNNQGEFDVWISDKNRDIIRLVGNIGSLSNGKSEIKLDNQLTHFGNIHPSTFSLILSDDFNYIENFDANFQFELGQFLQFLNQIHPFYPNAIFKKLNFLEDVGGTFDTSFRYDRQTDILSYHVLAENVLLDKWKFANVIFTGTKKSQVLSIDQLQLDDISFAAEFQNLQDLWKINFLGLRIGNGLLLGLEGNYSPIQNSIEAKINLFDANFVALKQWPFLASAISQYFPKGEMRAHGNFSLTLPHNKVKFQANANLKCTLKDLEWKGLVFQNISPVTCQFDSEKGIFVEHLKTSILSPKGTYLGQITNGEIDYQFGERELKLKNLNFQLPTEKLSNLLTILHEKFAALFPFPIQRSLSISNKKHLFEGNLNGQINNKQFSMKVSLPEGNYQVFDSEYHIEKAILEWDSFGVKGNLKYTHQNLPLWLLFRSKLPDFTHGDILVYAGNAKRNQAEPLVIQWNYLNNLWVIEKIHGNFQGIKFLLNGQEDLHALKLNGEIAIDPQEALWWISPIFGDMIKNWQIDGKYSLKGLWTVSRNDLTSWQNKLNFSGAFLGSNCVLMGHLIDRIGANVSYNPLGIYAHNLQIDDVSGKLTCERLELNRNSDSSQWHLSVPNIVVENFRPFSCRSLTSTPSKENCLNIKKMFLKNLKGNILDPQSLQGTGEAQCNQLLKASFGNALLNIPSELFSKLGIDFSAIYPKSGTFYFDIAKGKILFTKIKDMVSANGMTKFTLLKNPSKPSFIDFDGNVYLQMRMKQYHLLFKLAELLTLTVQGPWQKPTYTLSIENALH